LSIQLNKKASFQRQQDDEQGDGELISFFKYAEARNSPIQLDIVDPLVG